MSQHAGRKIADLTVKEYEEVIKVYNADIYDKIVKLQLDVKKLQEENEKISAELTEYKQRTALLEHDLAQVDKKQKRSNVIFRGLEESSSPKSSVEQVCSQIMEVPNIAVKEAKKTYNRNGKMTVCVELNDESMVYNLLKNSSKLKGSSISVDRDLTRDAREKKTAMLFLKKQLFAIDNTKKVIVRDDRMKIENDWFYWNREKQLMSGNLEGKTALLRMYNDKDRVNCLNINYKEICIQASRR